MKRPVALVTISFVLLALVACGGSQSDNGDSAATPVSPSDDLARIVADAPDGAELALQPGDHVLTTTLTVDRAITVVGAASDRVRIVRRDGLNVQQTSESAHVVGVDGGSFTASGVTLVHEGAVQGDVIRAIGGSVTLSDVVLTGAARTDLYGRGLLLGEGSSGTLTNVVSSGNAYHGILVSDTSSLTMTGGAVTGNGEQGVILIGDATGTIQNANIGENTLTGVWVWDRASAVLTGNTVENNGDDGVAFADTSTGEARDNTVQGNDGCGVRVAPDATPTLEGNTVSGNALGDVCDERVAGTALEDVQLSIDTPSTLDSGSRVRADITVRTDEPDGVRVRLRPYAEGLADYPFTYSAASDLLQGPVATGESYFGTVVADDDVAFDGVRVLVLSATGELLLDDVVAAPFTFRSLASTDATLAPSSGTLDQGQPVQVDVKFSLDEVQPVRVIVGPVRPSGYDDQASGDWFDVHDTAFEPFEGVAAGTLSGSFTILDDAVGDVRVDEVYVSILDETTGFEIYVAYLPMDVTFVEPGP